MLMMFLIYQFLINFGLARRLSNYKNDATKNFVARHHYPFLSSRQVATTPSKYLFKKAISSIPKDFWINFNKNEINELFIPKHNLKFDILEKNHFDNYGYRNLSEKVQELLHVKRVRSTSLGIRNRDIGIKETTTGAVSSTQMVSVTGSPKAQISSSTPITSSSVTTIRSTASSSSNGTSTTTCITTSSSVNKTTTRIPNISLESCATKNVTDKALQTQTIDTALLLFDTIEQSSDGIHSDGKPDYALSTMRGCSLTTTQLPICSTTKKKTCKFRRTTKKPTTIKCRKETKPTKCTTRKLCTTTKISKCRYNKDLPTLQINIPFALSLNDLKMKSTTISNVFLEKHYPTVLEILAEERMKFRRTCASPATSLPPTTPCFYSTYCGNFCCPKCEDSVQFWFAIEPKMSSRELRNKFIGLTKFYDQYKSFNNTFDIL